MCCVPVSRACIAPSGDDCDRRRSRPSGTEADGPATVFDAPRRRKAAAVPAASSKLHHRSRVPTRLATVGTRHPRQIRDDARHARHRRWRWPMANDPGAQRATNKTHHLRSGTRARHAPGWGWGDAIAASDPAAPRTIRGFAPFTTALTQAAGALPPPWRMVPAPRARPRSLAQPPSAANRNRMPK